MERRVPDTMSDEDALKAMRARVLFPLAASGKALGWPMLDRWCDPAFLQRPDGRVVGSLPGVVASLKEEGALLEDARGVRITPGGRTLLGRLEAEGFDGDTRKLRPGR